MRLRVLIVADDFTGACDTGVQFARPGRPCTVAIRPMGDADERFQPGRRDDRTSEPEGSEPDDTDIVVVDTESRHVPADVAAGWVRRVVTQTVGTDADAIVFKKIDSTFRGNVASEVNAVLDALPDRVALVVAAYPAAGRTTVDGRCLVNGVPLDSTEYARDPLAPVSTSSVADIVTGRSVGRRGGVAEQPERQADHRHAVPRRTRNASGPEAVRRAVHDASPGDLVIVDATTQDDVDAALSVVAEDLRRFVLVGSAGLAAALGRVLLGPADRHRPTERPSVARRRVLGVAGSLSARTRRQIETLVASGRAELHVGGAPSSDAAVRAAAETMATGGSVVLVSPNERVPDPASVVRRLSFDARAILERLESDDAAGLPQRPTDSHSGPSPAGVGLVLTGGETALAVLRELAVDRVDVVRELAPGVPVLDLYGRYFSGPAVSKAGGFGGDDILVKAFTYLEEGR